MRLAAFLAELLEPLQQVTMMATRLFLLFVALLAAAPMASAEKVLIPVAFPGPIPGAHGSLWAVELVGYNAADRYILVKPFGNCAITCPTPPALPRSSFTVWTLNPSPGPGWYLYIHDPEHELISFNLRVRDLSRQLETWGTEIPVIRQSDVPAGQTVVLPVVPNEPGFRTTLRIYDLAAGIETTVRLRVLAEDSGELLREEVVSLTDFGLTAHVPVQVVINDFSNGLASPRVRVEIVPANAESQVWAFVTVTHDETQHVTTITPQ